MYQDTMYGIDISNWQSYVDLGAAHHEGGKSFAFVETSDGLVITNQLFADQWHTLRRLKMVRGAYHFCRFHLPVDEQIDEVHRFVRESGRFEYGDAIALDVEESNGQSVDTIKAWLVDAVEKCKKDIAKQVIIYTGFSFWVEYLGNPYIAQLRDCPLWQASWGPNAAPLHTWSEGMAFWQYDGNGHCPGVNGPCDLDKFLGNWHQLNRIMRPPWAK